LSHSLLSFFLSLSAFAGALFLDRGLYVVHDFSEKVFLPIVEKEMMGGKSEIRGD
jgi:hypothetical protein